MQNLNDFNDLHQLNCVIEKNKRKTKNKQSDETGLDPVAPNRASPLISIQLWTISIIPPLFAKLVFC